MNGPPYRDSEPDVLSAGLRQNESEYGLAFEMSAFFTSLRWPTYLINLVNKTTFLCFTPPSTQSHSFFRNQPL